MYLIRNLSFMIKIQINKGIFSLFTINLFYKHNIQQLFYNHIHAKLTQHKHKDTSMYLCILCVCEWVFLRNTCDVSLLFIRVFESESKEDCLEWTERFCLVWLKDKNLCRSRYNNNTWITFWHANCNFHILYSDMR